MLAPWVMEEVETVKLNDKRLDARLGELLSQLSAQPRGAFLLPAADVLRWLPPIVSARTKRLVLKPLCSRIWTRHGGELRNSRW